MGTSQLQDVPTSVERQRVFLSRLLAVLDMLAAVLSLAIIAWQVVSAPTSEQLARMDPEAGWMPIFAAVVLVPLAALFMLAAVGHWRRYSWRWVVQWIPVGIALLVAIIIL